MKTSTIFSAGKAAFSSAAWIGVCALFAMISVNGTSKAGTTADAVLGQDDFSHNRPNTVAPTTIFTQGTGGNVLVDRSATPNHLYVIDSGNHRVLGFKSASALTNHQAADLAVGQNDLYSGTPNIVGDAVSAISLKGPRGAAVDSAGNLYVADSANNRVLIFSNPFTALAGQGQTGGFAAIAVLGQAGNFASSNCNVGGSTASAETLCDPFDVKVDSKDRVYVADGNNNRVLEYDNPFASFDATRVFGQADFVGNKCNQGGSAGANTLCDPSGLAFDSNDNLYVADRMNNRLLEYDTPIIKGTTATNVWGHSGSFTTVSCGSSATTLCAPVGVALDTSNNLYIADLGNNRALEYNEPMGEPNNFTANVVFGQGGVFNTGVCNKGLSSAMASADTLCDPFGIAADSAGNVFISDVNNDRVLKYNTPLTTDTTADVELGQIDFSHNAQNSIDGSRMSFPFAAAIDSSGHVWVVDQGNNRVLGYTSSGSITNDEPASIILGQPGFATGDANDGGSISNANLSQPSGVAVDSSGNVYVADTNDCRVLEFSNPFTACGSPPCAGQAANMVLGQGDPGNFTTGCLGAAASATSLNFPIGVALDSFGNLYVGDQDNSRVLEYNTPLTKTSVTGSGDVTADLVIGQSSFTASSCNQASTPTASTLCTLFGLAVDASNNLYVADAGNSRVLEYNETPSAIAAPANATANQVFGQFGSFTSNVPNNGEVSADTLNSPQGIALDSPGHLFVADTSNSRALEYFNPLSSTTADVVFGQGGNFTSTTANIDAAGGRVVPDANTLSGPAGAVVDMSGRLFIADTNNSRVLRYPPPFTAPPLAPPVIPQGSVAISRKSIHFHARESMTRSKFRSVNLINTGNTTVNLFRVTILGDFQQTNSCGLQIPPGGECEFQVAFSPTTPGPRSGRLLMTTDAPHSPIVVELRGRGLRRRNSR